MDLSQSLIAKFDQEFSHQNGSYQVRGILSQEGGKRILSGKGYPVPDLGLKAENDRQLHTLGGGSGTKSAPGGRLAVTLGLLGGSW